jgi:hypothetical protein
MQRKRKAECSRLAGACWRVGRAQRSAETREPRAALTAPQSLYSIPSLVPRFGLECPLLILVHSLQEGRVVLPVTELMRLLTSNRRETLKSIQKLMRHVRPHALHSASTTVTTVALRRGAGLALFRWMMVVGVLVNLHYDNGRDTREMLPCR